MKPISRAKPHTIPHPRRHMRERERHQGCICAVAWHPPTHPSTHPWLSFWKSTMDHYGPGASLSEHILEPRHGPDSPSHFSRLLESVLDCQIDTLSLSLPLPLPLPLPLYVCVCIIVYLFAYHYYSFAIWLNGFGASRAKTPGRAWLKFCKQPNL